MFWDDEPATEQQLMHLKNAGYEATHPLNRTDAARLIREFRRNPARALAMTVPASVPSALPQSRPPAPEPAPLPQPAFGTHEISEATRIHAFKLRGAVEAAQRALATHPDAPNVRADSLSTVTARREFWLDTCREFKEMHTASMQVLELYQRYGCRFFAPNAQQTQELLDALDAALPVWDRDHQELFYQALELNFPHMVKRGLAGRAA